MRAIRPLHVGLVVGEHSGDQLGFKAEVDPHGLLNPGKLQSYTPVRP